MSCIFCKWFGKPDKVQYTSERFDVPQDDIIDAINTINEMWELIPSDYRYCFSITDKKGNKGLEFKKSADKLKSLLGCPLTLKQFINTPWFEENFIPSFNRDKKYTRSYIYQELRCSWERYCRKGHYVDKSTFDAVDKMIKDLVDWHRTNGSLNEEVDVRMVLYAI